jgi:hypothetical protein
MLGCGDSDGSGGLAAFPNDLGRRRWILGCDSDY